MENKSQIEETADNSSSSDEDLPTINERSDYIFADELPAEKEDESSQMTRRLIFFLSAKLTVVMNYF